MSCSSQPAELWAAFDEVFAEFARSNAALGLTESKWGALHARRVHGAALLDAGVARQTRTGRWLANRETFAPVAFELMTNSPLAKRKARAA